MALWQRPVASKVFPWQVYCRLPEASIVTCVHKFILPTFILWVFLLADCPSVYRGLGGFRFGRVTLVAVRVPSEPRLALCVHSLG